MTDLGLVLSLILATAISGNAIVKHEFEIAEHAPAPRVRSAGVVPVPNSPAAPAGAHEKMLTGSR